MGPTIVLTRDEDACVRCGECVDACPHSGEGKFVKSPVITQDQNEVPQMANPENCIGCLSCKDICRSDAIQVSGINEIHSYLLDAQVWEKLKRIL